MTAMSRFLEDAFINAVFRGTTFTSPSTLWLGLNSSAGADETTGAWLTTEVVGTAYARTEAPLSGWTGASGGMTSNVGSFAFKPAGSDWGSVTHVSIWDAATGGNLLFKSELIVPRTIVTGDLIAFPAGNLIVQLR